MMENIVREIMVALFVFEHQNKCSEYTIAEQFFWSTSTVHRAISRLRQRGVIIYSRHKHLHITLSLKQANKFSNILVFLEQTPQKILKEYREAINVKTQN